MSKHTPGPWKFNGQNESYNDPITSLGGTGPYPPVVFEAVEHTSRYVGLVGQYAVVFYNEHDIPIIEQSPEMYDLLLKLSRCVAYGEGGTIQVLNWQMLEDVLQGGYAIYQEVEGI